MTLDKVTIEKFRNIELAELQLCRGINFVQGNNAAGKTSIIEALYFLTRARSFRTKKTEQLVNCQSDYFRIIAKSKEKEVGIVGVERNKEGLDIRHNGQRIQALSKIAEIQPVLLISNEFQRVFDDGPAVRRKLIDWGIYYQVSEYRMVLNRYARALKSRNAALRSNMTDREIRIWNKTLVEDGKKIADYREEYCKELGKRGAIIAKELIKDSQIEITFKRGWAENRELSEALERDRERDRKTGITNSGPHRDDFKVYDKGKEVSEVYSRGQLKRAQYALIISQKQIYREKVKDNGLVLIDDLRSELDSEAENKIIDLINDIGGQYLITLIPQKGVKLRVNHLGTMFHVEHGCVKQVQ